MVDIHIQYLRHRQTNFEVMKLLLTTYTFYGTYNELKLISNSATKGQNGVSHKAMRFGVSRLINGEGNGTPPQHSCMENPMDGGAWWAAVHAKGRTQLSNFTFTFHFHALEKEIATHSSVLAWRIPGTGEPGGLPFMGSHRVGHH